VLRILFILIFIFAVIVQPVSSFAGKCLTLDKAISIALEKNPLITSKKNEVTASGEGKRAAWGELLPQINSYGSYSRLSDPVAVTPAKSASKPPDAFSRSLYRYGVNLKLPVYEGGRLWAQVSIAGFSKAISEANLRFTRQDIIANVTNIFNRILFLKSLIRAREETLVALEKLQKDAKTRLSVGRIAPVDLMRIETQVASQKQALIDTREDERRSRQTLGFLIGTDPSSLPDAKGILLPPSKYPITDRMNRKFDEIIRNRPDVRRGIEEVERARAEVRFARGYHLPSLDIVGDYGRRAGSGFNGDDTVWSYGLNISFNIFSGGVISARVGEAEAKLLSAKNRLHNTKLNARTELLHAVSLLRSARHRFKVARDIEATAMESFRVEDLKYSRGAGTITDSLITQAEWLSARANELSALYDIHRAIVAYKLAAGIIDRGYP